MTISDEALLDEFLHCQTPTFRDFSGVTEADGGDSVGIRVCDPGTPPTLALWASSDYTACDSRLSLDVAEAFANTILGLVRALRKREKSHAAVADAPDDDRHALNAYLDKAGYRRSGDLVYLNSIKTATAENHPTESAVVAEIATSELGTIFSETGARFDRFRKNPVVLYNHDYEGLPVARSLWERVRTEHGKTTVIAKPQFHMDTCLSREVCRLVMSDTLTAWGLGVIPATWGETKDYGFQVITWDVLEYSVLPDFEDMAGLREEQRKRHITAPALIKSITAE